MHGDDRVEAAVGEGHPHRVHLQQAGDVGEALAPDPRQGALEHLGRGVDADDRGILPIERQRQAGADADVEDALVRPPVGEGDRVLPPGMEDRAFQHIVKGREAAIARANGR